MCGHNSLLLRAGRLIRQTLCPTEPRAHRDCFDSKSFLVFVSIISNLTVSKPVPPPAAPRQSVKAPDFESRLITAMITKGPLLEQKKSVPQIGNPRVLRTSEGDITLTVRIAEARNPRCEDV